MELPAPVLVLDLGGTWTRAAVVDSGWRVHARRREPTLLDDGPDAVVDACVRLLNAVRSDPSAPTPVAIGVSTPGPVDPWAGVIVDPPNLGPDFHDVALAARLEAALGLPAVLDRDTQAAALAEGTVGIAAKTADFVYLTVSTGIGGAVVSGGRLLRGPDGTAGELGHLMIDINGPLCGCGARGHLEAIASGTGIAREGILAAIDRRSAALAQRMEERADSRLTAADVAAAEDAGDEIAADILECARRAFAAACVTIADVFDPDLIVVGGGVANGQDERLLRPAREAVALRAFRAPALRTMVVRASLGDDVGLVGAAALVAERGSPRAG